MIFCLTCDCAYPAHPLLTEDGYTQGKGVSQLEFSGEYINRKNTDTDTTVNILTGTTIFTHGIADNVDVLISSSFQSTRANVQGSLSRQSGIGDSAIDVKWKLYEKNSVAIAVKPGVTLPTGDYNKQLGNGEVRYRAFIISSFDLNRFALHLNMGYMRHENRLDERKNLTQASLAGEWRLTKRFKFIANAGIETCRDKSYTEDPVLFLFGMIYKLADNVDLDLGVRKVIVKPEDNFSGLAGITFRF